MRSLIARSIGALWTIVAALTIALAILISVIRLMLPQIDQQRGAIEIWLSDITSRPVKIGAVSASWRGWTPTIDVTDLVLLASDRSAELVRFDTASIDISPMTSLRQRNLVPRRLIVGGMRIALERDAEGNISVAGMPPSRWPVAQWLLQQQNFTLRDAYITFTDTARDSEPLNFSEVTLSITHDAGQLNFAGSLRRDDREIEKYVFALRAAGDILGSEWSGDLFVEMEHAEAGPILALAGWAENRIVNGAVNAQIWSRWEDAKLQRVGIELNGSAIRLSGHTSELIKAIDTAVMAVRQPDGWSLDIDRLRIGSADESRTESSGAVRWSERGNGPPLVAFRASNVNLAEVAPLFVEHFDAAGEIFSELRTLNPRGRLDNVLGAVAPAGAGLSRYFIQASVNDLSINESARIPGVSGLDFAIRANSRGGVVDATQTQGVVLQSERWLVRPVEIQKIIGEVVWDHSPKGLSINTDLVEIRAESVDFSTRGMVTWLHGRGPDLNFVTRINSGDLARIHLLVPKDKLPPRGEIWLRNAFRAGQFKPSGLVVHGNLEDFPFDEGNGTFKGSFDVMDVDLQYSSKWPMTTGIAASISVDKRKADVSVHDGRIYHSLIGGSTIELPDVFSRKQTVRVHGTTRVSPDEVSKFIAQSPLKNTKAARFSDVEISNDFEMTLDMNLGLYPEGEKEILGLARFSGNDIHSKKQRITLEEVSGDISFTRQDWYGEGLTAIFDGDRVGVILNGGLDDPNYDTEIRMTGTSDAQQLFKYLERYAPILYSWLTQGSPDNSIAGRLPWKAVLTIPEASENGKSVPKRLTIESSLLGLDVDLPWPFGKSSAEQKPLMIRTETRHNGDRLTRIDFGTTVDIEIDQIRRDEGTVETRRAEILFGDASPVFNHEPGLVARGHIDRLPLNEWAAFANAAAGSVSSYGAEFPISFDVSVDNLETLGRTFQGARLKGEKTESAWQVDVSSDQALGTISIPRGTPEQPLTLDFERLWLEKIDPEKNLTRIDPRALPPINLTCESFRFGNIDLGSAELVTTRVESGLKLEKLDFSQPDFTLRGSGDWLLEADDHQSRVRLTVQGKTLGGLLKSFDYDVANIDGGKTKIGIEAGWGGMPSEFTLDKLHGNFSLAVDKGRFLDIEPGTGRLFGLLSLQTLPRRLSLDFNDLFKKGFSFDSIEGSFELDRGNAYTNSLLMNGPSARILISGRTGLADQDYDQHVTVTPALSNTIPVASALFGPAGIGVGAVIYLGQKIFKSIPAQVDKLLSREYSITGDWEQPVIERI